MTRIDAVSEIATTGGANFPATLDSVGGSPGAGGILFVLLGYYLAYYTAVLLRGLVLRKSAPTPA